MTAPKSAPVFASIFESLTGNPPYPWQENLFLEFLSGSCPRDINLPTGSGKTSIMPIWLFALATQATWQPQAITIPRRLVWVVNRRVVVDQATEEAEQIRRRLADTGLVELDPVRNALRGLLLERDKQELIAISTLRGEKEDNREWSDDPSRPAIIIGTVDMIGSRLLFSGYGDGPYWRAQHAGLLGHDTLIVNDEAHLTPAFATLLRAVEEKQRKSLRPFCTIRLSATHSSTKCWPESLDDDNKDAHFRKIYEAPKTLQIREAGKQFSTLLELATQPGARRTLIFAQTPDTVAEIADKLKKKVGDEAAILTLTGTMRGFERDRMVESAVFKAFAGAERPSESYWLIATSAGEVGINISADRLITDLDTLDHLLQRFGRLNRFGETTGEAYVLVSNASQKEDRNKAALDFLRSLDSCGNETYDISPAALFGRELPSAACSEVPLLAELHDWLIDVWSQTSLGAHSARPAVDPWLHGNEKDRPETHVAWRDDVRDLVGDEISREDREEALQKYRLLAHEQLREPSTKLLEKLEKLAQAQDGGTSFLLRKADGSVDVKDLSEFAKIETESQRRSVIADIAFCQLILPPGCGSIREGMFFPESNPDFEKSGDGNSPYDVSGLVWSKKEGAPIANPDRASYRAKKDGDGKWTVRRLGVSTEYAQEEGPLVNLQLGTLRQFSAAKNLRFLLAVTPETEDGDNSTALLYFGKARPKTGSAPTVFIDDHCPEVADLAKKLAGYVGLSEEVAAALQLAGQLHDLGKRERIWQDAAGNPLMTDGTFKYGEPIAKSVEIMRGKSLGGFRHELASLRYAEKELGTQPLSPELRDLVLHLVAAHHGHARPCFESKAYDRNYLGDSARIALESAQRFARLQERYGAWGLAYLESILRAADWMVSANSVAGE